MGCGVFRIAGRCGGLAAGLNRRGFEAWERVMSTSIVERAAGSLPLRSDRRSRQAAGLDFLKKLEPEIKLFSFDKFAKPFSELTDQEKDEELIHFRTGYSFAKKVVSTGECDVLILDEVLGLFNIGALKQEDLTALLDQAQDGMEIYLTGQTKVESIWPYVDEVTEVVTDYRNPRD